MQNSFENENSISGSPEVDLTNCDREPIHVPGAIQPHGLLLALDEADLRIVQVSSNCGDFLGIDSNDLLGNSLTAALGAAQTDSFRATLASSDLRACNPMKLSIGSGTKSRLVNGIVHRHQGVLFLELEPAGEPLDAPLSAYLKVQAALSKLQRAITFEDLWRTVVQEVQAILGYQRVMIYQFDRSGNGSVIAEQAPDCEEKYLGLHYPASDIPRQARLLYSLNCIRHIPDVNYKPAALLPLIYPLTRDLTDLSYSTLRSVSPIHIEYLQNMGVEASLSISLMSGTSLWGLIACHNYSPKFVPYELRAACELLGQVISLQMVALESSDQTRYKSTTNGLQAKFMHALSTSKDLQIALIKGNPSLLDYVPCGGSALVRGKECFTVGQTPTPDQIGKLIKRMRRFASPVFATDDLHSVFSEAAEYKDVASGVLGLIISKEKDISLLWFRPEQTRTVNWAGNPDKSVTQHNDMRLHPRASFALWKEEVVNKALPWTENEVQSATELRSTMMGLLLNGLDAPS